MKLFATDLDGTLLSPGDRIHPKDVEAIRAAREQGIIFTIATGRLTSRTHNIARALELDAPLICADGGVLACSTTERVLSQRAIERDLSVAVLEQFSQSALTSFVFTHDSIHSCEAGRVHHAFVRGWAHHITTHPDVRAAVSTQDHAIMLLGIGTADEVSSVLAKLDEFSGAVDAFTFELEGRSVVRLIAKDTSKGAALVALAAELGVAAQDTAVIGDWYNDLSMFQVAGQSFAMPHAPEDVRTCASATLLAEEVREQGPIATALQRWLEPSR